MKNYLITLKNSPAPVPLAMPSQWEDVTLAQYIDLIAKPEIPPLATLTGLDAAQVKNIWGGDLAILLQELDFLNDSSALLACQPTPGLPDVGASTYGQLLLAGQYAQEHEGQSQLVCAPYFYALYRSHQLRGEYDQAHLDELLTATLAAPVLEVWSDVVFIWAAWQIFTNAMLPMKTTWKTTPTTNTRPEPMKYLKGLVRLPRWTH